MTDYSTETHEHLNANRYRRRLKLPSQLERVLAGKQRQNPGDDILLELVPFITDPLDFLPTFDAMLFNSGPSWARTTPRIQIFMNTEVHVAFRAISRGLMPNSRFTSRSIDESVTT